MNRKLAAVAGAAMVCGGPAMAAPQDQHQGAVQEVIVTAAPYSVPVASSLTSVDVLNRQALDKVTGGLGDALASTPGVRSSFFGPGASRPVIRGLSGPRVLVLNNGVGLIDASGLSPDHQVASDPQEAETIEVLRGPSALAYGGSAIGGVVNIIDGRIPSTYDADLHGRALVSRASADHGVDLSGALAKGLGDGVMLTLDGTRKRADDYRAPVPAMSDRLAAQDGLPAPVGGATRIPNSYSNLNAYGAGLSWAGDDSFAGVAIKRTRSDYGVPSEPDVYIGLKQTRIDARGAAPIDLGPFERVKVAGGYADYAHTEFENGEVGTTFLSKGAEGRVELVQRNVDGWQGALGFQALTKNLDAIGEEALIPQTRTTELGVFSLQRLDRERWGLEGGLRLDTRRLNGKGGDADFTNVSASAGGFVRPAQGWFLGLAVSRTSRAPTVEELFSFGAHPATEAFEIGDKTLTREIATSVEATAHHSGAGWRLDLHLFNTRYRNYIDEFRSGEIDADSGLAIFRYVQTSARFSGGELEASVDAWKAGEGVLKLEASADYVRSTTGLGPAPRTPPWSVVGRAEWSHPVWTASAEVRRVAKQDRVAAFELPTDGYTLVNLSADVRPLPDKPQFKLFIEARNLGDVEAREHASFLKDVAPLPGRNIRVGAGYRF
jgi:iron complex outermembrane receptor protein